MTQELHWWFKHLCCFFSWRIEQWLLKLCRFPLEQNLLYSASNEFLSKRPSFNFKRADLPNLVMMPWFRTPEPVLFTSRASRFLCRSSVWKSWQPPHLLAHQRPPATHLHPRPLLLLPPQHQAPPDPAMTCWVSTATPLRTTCNLSWPTRTAHRSLWPATPSERPPSSNSKPMALPQVRRSGSCTGGD